MNRDPVHQKWSRVVVDGDTVKLRCVERQQESQSGVVVDEWRFSLPLSKVLLAPLFDQPELKVTTTSIWDPAYQRKKLKEAFAEFEIDRGEEGEALEKAFQLAEDIAGILGDQFLAFGTPAKGRDFYKWRVPIFFNNTEVATVYCWASGSDKRRDGQRNSLNVHIHGTACTFASPGWQMRLHAKYRGDPPKVTGGHLAADFFDGYPGGLQAFVDEHKAGEFDHLGKRPKISGIGFPATDTRSLYFGAIRTGFRVNFYEKGDQIYGAEEAKARGIKWIRIEQRWGNQLRVLSWDMLIRPADFFSGASQAYHRLLQFVQEQQALTAAVTPTRIMCTRPDAPMHVEGEVARSVAWGIKTAGPTLALLYQYMKPDQLIQLVDQAALPGRMKKFSHNQIQACFSQLEVPWLDGGIPNIDRTKSSCRAGHPARASLN